MCVERRSTVLRDLDADNRVQLTDKRRTVSMDHLKKSASVLQPMYSILYILGCNNAHDSSIRAAQNGREVPGAGSWALCSFARHVSDVTNVANAPISGMIASLYALQKIIFKNERAWRN